MNIATMSQRELLAQINVASNARRRYELADGNRWRDETHAREAVGAELCALEAEWRKRNLG
ncbi:hypothetical protein BLA17378_08630 [Burkholderia aenigmatica]|uniref:Uncharacterized protein n=1 Tax=Burkholderia aenigmatica TaxID=2015348 RepID=A0ABY6Y7G9_9BURK|nr:hypothetical protein [Burkholderia aenigmatica]VWD49727.1 hypothetical protein BLA17378_08630 [Burkholderia aenigmatica]